MMEVFDLGSPGLMTSFIIAGWVSSTCLDFELCMKLTCRVLSNREASP